MRIKHYVGKLPVPRTFEEGGEILRWWFHAQYPKLAPQDWIAFAQRTWREHRGALMPNHDLKLARALRGLSLERLPTLWDQFDALAHIPLCYGQPPRPLGNKQRCVIGTITFPTPDCANNAPFASM